MAPTRAASLAMRSASCAHHRRVVDPDEGLGEQRHGTDRCLELVTHVGHEVAAHGLDPPRLGDVTHQADRPDAPAVHREWSRRHPEHLRRRAEELELARALLASARPVEQLPQRLAHERVRVACIVEPARALVAQDDVTGGIHDHDGITDRVEGLRQPALVQRAGGLRLGETVVGQQGTTTHVHLFPSVPRLGKALIRTAR